jgi:ubiquinone/menaquinone biosynthesis C-methylase UbiE
MIGRDSDKLSAIEAKSIAQWIAFGPVVFHAAATMRDTGLLEAVANGGSDGLEVSALAERVGLSAYGVSVLLDFGADIGLVTRKGAGFTLGKVGHFLLYSEMTRVNMDFTRDVCYQALPYLEASIRESRPVGLKTLGPWDTVYEGLAELPDHVRASWFGFDHYYSDAMFDAALPLVFERPVRELLDVGGNTGRFARKCLAFDPEVRVTIMDLPGQVKDSRRRLEEEGLGDRVRFRSANLLEPSETFPDGADVIWMSQFLDCFGEAEIVSILRRAAEVMRGGAELYIVEVFADRQKYEAAAFSLDALSLYFTCVANGKSRMYHYEPFVQLIQAAGLRIDREVHDIGMGHTLFRCLPR